jgi:hypothetical protein
MRLLDSIFPWRWSVLVLSIAPGGAALAETNTAVASNHLEKTSTLFLGEELNLVSDV